MPARNPHSAMEFFMYSAPLDYIIKWKKYIGNTCYPGPIITESLKLKRPEMESRSYNSELVHVC